jgi:hypothetical protein
MSDGHDGSAHKGASASERLWRYSAPELIRSVHLVPPSTASDSYALGCLLWEVLTCQECWHELSEAQVRALVQRGMRPPLTEFFAPHVRALLQECWSELPAERPTPPEIMFRLAGGKNSAYMYLPKSTLRSSLHLSNSATSKSKSVKWALSLDQKSELNEDHAHNQLQKRRDFGSPALPLPQLSHVSPTSALRDDTPLNDIQQLVQPNSIQDQIFARSESILPMPTTPDVVTHPQNSLHLQKKTVSDVELAASDNSAHGLSSTVVTSTPRGSQFSLHLSHATLKNDAFLQKQQHDSDIARAIEHVRPAQPALNGQRTAAGAHQLLMQAPPLTASSITSHLEPQPLRQSPQIPQVAASAIQFSHNHVQDSPSKASSQHYHAASSLAAHVLAAKHLDSSKSNTAAHSMKFEQCECFDIAFLRLN